MTDRSKMAEHHTVPVHDLPMSEEAIQKRESFLRRHGLGQYWKPTGPASEKEAKYREKFRMAAAYEMSERQAKEIAWEIADEKAQASGSELFAFDDFNTVIFRNMFYYFCFDARCEWNLHKGIALIGGVGSGKTILFEIFSTMLARHFQWSPRRFPIVKASAILREYKEGGDASLASRSSGNLCIDDVGDEAEALKLYGNSIPVVEELLKARYERHKAGNGITHITSNLDIGQVIEKYGDRAADRMGQMMTFVSVPGGSRRPK